MKTTWKKHIGTIISVAAIGLFVYRFLNIQEIPELSTVLIQAASDINKNVPMMLDSETRLDNAMVVSGKFRYNKTLVNYSAEELEESKILLSGDDLMDWITKETNRICTIKEMQFFVENNIPLEHAYHGKNGKHVQTVVIETSQCKSS